MNPKNEKQNRTVCKHIRLTTSDDIIIREVMEKHGCTFSKLVVKALTDYFDNLNTTEDI